MIDINLIREDAKAIEAKLLKKGHTVDFTELLEWDKTRRELLQNVESKKAEKNKVSAEIPALKKAGQDVAPVLAEMKKLGNEIDELDKKVAEVEEKMNYFLLSLPNVPDDDLLAGGKEANATVRVFGEKPNFDFTPKSHIELCEDLGLIDYERGAKLAGNGSWVYRGMGARLEWALLNFFIDEHCADGYEFMLLPHMLNYDCGLGAGQFPKFEDEVYWIDAKSKENKFLLPTAETALVNLYKGEVLTEADLPKKFAGFTPCYRREAGSYRSEERGMIRGHQFHKVEMVQYTTKEGSDAAFEELVAKAERLVQKLGLHYQLAKLAAGDCSASMCRTYDIEVWIPSMGIYKEVSSVSNARDYQARRNNTRYRSETTKKLEYVHTLNGSGLATTRIFQLCLSSIKMQMVVSQYLRYLESIWVV